MTSLEKLNNQCENCKKCELHTIRTNVVFGEGNPEADLLIIGEAPGENEDLQGRPFVGGSGKLLDKVLNENGLSREKNVYILNTIKCRPPKNRDPKPEEILLCSEYLKEQIKLINPKVILCLGRISAQILISKDFKVTKQHGEIFTPEQCTAKEVFKQNPDLTIIGTFHPAAILRNPNNMPLFEEDIKYVKSLIIN